MKRLRIGVFVLIVFSVVSFGGVEPWGKAILELAASALLLWWGILAVCRGEVEIRGNWLFAPLLGLGALAIVQYAFGISIYPYLTKVDLLLWSAFLILGFLALQCFRTIEHARQLAWFLATLAFFVSLFAIVQYFTFNGNLYWTISLPPGAVPFGPFVNHNHFAGFVELSVLPGLALLLFSNVPREKRVLLGLFTAVSIGALLFSASRGGIFAFAFGFLLLCLFAGIFGRTTHAVLVASVVVVLSCVVITWLGATHTMGRFETMTEAAEMGSSGRLTFYDGAWQIFRSHPWVGTGVGTFETVYPQYETKYTGDIVKHAHNDYLELLADAGVTGELFAVLLIVLLVALALGRLRAPEGKRGRAVAAGCLSACAALLAHSFVDFNFHIPSNALLFILLALLATSPSEEPSPAHLNLPLE
jgi:O-antigen ligase